MKDDQQSIDWYSGFEGEPEIKFRYLVDTIQREFVMWDGYFYDIMMGIKPDPQGWTSLAYYYHLDIGWYDEDDWPIPDLPAAIRQIQSTELLTELVSSKTPQVHAELVAFLQAALVRDEPVLMSYS